MSPKSASRLPAITSRRDRGDGLADHLGDERHGAGSARVHLEHEDLAVLDGELHVHEPDDLQGERKLARLALELGQHLGAERMRRQRAGAVARMNAGLLDVLHDAGDEGVGAVGDAVDVDLDGIGQIAVDQQRALVGDDELGRAVERGGELGDVAVDLGAVVDDLHGASAEHVGGPDHHRIADPVGDRARLARRLGDAALGLLQLQALDQRLEAVAVLGEVDGVGRGAEDRHAGGCQRLGELQGRLPAELHDDAVQRALRLLGCDDLQHVLGRQRLEVEPVRGVVVGRHRLRVAVDHDGLKAGRREREAGVAAAVVELDALADAVGTAAEDDRPSCARWGSPRRRVRLAYLPASAMTSPRS